MHPKLRKPPRTTRAVGVLALGLVAGHHALRLSERRWEATVEECTAPLPGDETVAEPVSEITRAITIDAPAAAVWPWIVQLGADRGGFYSYAWLENLFGLEIRNADRVVPEWQERSVGDLVAADRAESGGWYVVALQPPDTLALAVADVAAGRPLRRDKGLRWEFLWTFALRELADDRCRLLVRERVAFGSRWTRVLMAPVGHVSFVMTRKMMLGIKARAERAARTSGGMSPLRRGSAEDMGTPNDHRDNAGSATEGTGAEQGLDEHSGLRDKAAREGADTAAALQDSGAAKRPAH